MHYLFYPEHHESSERTWMVADRLCLGLSASRSNRGDCIFFYMYQRCLRVQKVGNCAELINGPLCIFCGYA